MPQSGAEPTVTEFLLARADDEHHGLVFRERCWSWSEHVRCCAEHAALLRSLRQPHLPFHIGVLLDNRPEFSFLLGAAALSGAVLVGLNPTRRGAALARDVRATDCRIIVTERRYAPLLDGLDLDLAADRILVVDTPAWHDALEAHRHAPLAPEPATADDLVMLVFTSGTGGDPKAVRCTHGKLAGPGRMLADRFGLSARDVVYLAMPMFHSNALMAGWSVALASGATLALRERFSASEFLADVRRFGATYANYVGKPLSYVLATPARPDDAENPLRVAYGNEGTEADLARFAERFDCHVVDGFGSTEGGVAVQRTPDSPAGSLGRPADGVAVLDPETQQPCAPARFDSRGRLVNAHEAIGELVNTRGFGAFAGYYNDPEAEAQRMRSGMYWSGDLAYLDADGFCYFVGRSGDWMRVDGENLGTAPIERVLLRHHGIREVAVYAVPDPRVGDRIMAAIVPTGPESVEPETLGRFLRQQPDLGAKQLPHFLRLLDELPRTATHKVLKRDLAAQRWNCPDPVWWHSDRHGEFHRLNFEQIAELEAELDRE